jgi:PBSX family phage terminase large subunit
MKIPIQLHEFQDDFQLNKTRFRAFISGIGGGKTFVGCFEALQTALEFPGSLGVIVAPTYRMLSDTTRRTFFELCPPQLVKEWRKADNELVLINGSTILFRSADDPEKLRGANLSWFYLDEAAILPTDLTWKIMIGRLRLPPERGWLTTTPKGYNWVYDEFIKNPDDKHWYISFSTARNPFLSKDFIDSIREDYAGTFLRQEFYGEFTSFEGLVYPNFQPSHIIRDLPNINQIKRMVVGIDWGFTNPCVALFIGIDGDNNHYLLSEIYEKRLDIADFINMIKQREDVFYEKYKFRPEAYYCDPSEPRFIEEFKKANIKAVAADNEIMAGINAVTSLIDNNKMQAYEGCMNTITEIRQYRYPESGEGKPIKEAPLKIHDHCMDAMRYAIYNTRKKSRPAYLLR